MNDMKRKVFYTLYMIFNKYLHWMLAQSQHNSYNKKKITITFKQITIALTWRHKCLLRQEMKIYKKKIKKVNIQ